VRSLTATKALASRDTHAPLVTLQLATPEPGKSLTLAYRVSEDSERSREIVTVMADTGTLARIDVPIHRSVYAAARSVRFSVPSPVPAGLRYCVVASDPSGNSSTLTCMRLRGIS
jgi:hypothetical protein